MNLAAEAARLPLGILITGAIAFLLVIAAGKGGKK